jgi:hypothetical protein
MCIRQSFACEIDSPEQPLAAFQVCGAGGVCDVRFCLRNDLRKREPRDWNHQGKAFEDRRRVDHVPSSTRGAPPQEALTLRLIPP